VISVKRCQRAAACAALVLLGTGVLAAPARADDIRAQEWFLDRLHAQQAWSISKGAGVTVAVIDSGVEATHPDLRGQVLAGADFGDHRSPQGLVDTDTKFNGHGTAMASLIAGTAANGGGQGMLGLAPATKILPIYDDFGNDPTPAATGEGIEYAIQHGAGVINISSSGNVNDVFLRKAINDAIAHNVVVVVGAGNNGQRGNAPGYPAADPGVVAVAATDQSDKPADFSSYGPYVTLAAPGAQIVTAASHAGYAKGGGTSDSTALVSAAAALVRSHFPNLTAGQVINRLIKTADHPAGGRDDHVGYGIVNPYQALTADLPAGPPGDPLLAPTGQSQPSGGASGTATPATAPAAQSGTGRGAGIAVIAGITAAVLVVLAILVTLLLGVRRRRRSRPD
jgi:type VII secretion-associated serine protease mycosin